MSTPFSIVQTASLDFLYNFFGKVGIFLYITSKLLTTERRIDGLVKTIMLSGFLMAVATVISQQPGIRAAVGTTYDPNDMAMLMVVTLPLALTQGLATSNKTWKIVCYACVVFCLLALIATVSRGGFLGLIAVGAYILKTKMPGLPKKKLVLIGAVFGIFFLVIVGQDFMTRMSTIFEDVSGRRAGSGRILVWQRALVLAADHPLLGVGPNCFQGAYGRYLDEGKFRSALAPQPGEWAPGAWRVAHSAYLTVLAEFGFVGFIIYLIFFLQTFKNFNNLNFANLPVNSQVRIGLMSSGIKISFVGFLVCALFLSQAYSVLLFLYFFISGNTKRLFEKI